MQRYNVIKLRNSTKSDLVTIHRLINRLGIPITMRDLSYRFQLYSKNTLNKTWVAEENSSGKLVVVGCASVYVAPRLLQSTNQNARVVNIMVDENYRRQGVGNLLINRIEHYAAQIGCLTLELPGSNKDHTAVDQFYRQLGYLPGQENSDIYVRQLSTGCS